MMDGDDDDMLHDGFEVFQVFYGTFGVIQFLTDL